MISLPTWGQSIRIYKGNQDCPKTVCIQMLDSPDANIANVYISPDKAELDQAQSKTDSTGNLPFCSAGFPVLNTAAGQDFPTSNQLIIPDCKSDLYARAVNWVSGSNPAVPKLNQNVVITIIAV